MPRLLRPLFGSKQVLLRSTPKPVTPFGGLVSFLEFLQRLALPQQLAATREKKLLATIDMGSPMSTSPVAANGVLYVATMNRLFAVQKTKAPVR